MREDEGESRIWSICDLLFPAWKEGGRREEGSNNSLELTIPSSYTLSHTEDSDPLISTKLELKSPTRNMRHSLCPTIRSRMEEMRSSLASAPPHSNPQ